MTATTAAAARSVSDHLAEALALAPRLAAETLHLTAAAGRTLAATAHAAHDAPAWDTAAMDGYAVRHSDTRVAPADLDVVADVPAGSDLDPRLRPGEAARIMTGAPVPSDADSVVPTEDTEPLALGALARTRVVHGTARRGIHVRHRGEDLRAGDAVVRAGAVLRPRQLAALAAAGHSHVQVSVAPRVVVIATGDELATAGSPLRRGRIHESNSTLLAGLARSCGAEVRVHVAGDEVGAFDALVRRPEVSGADVVVSSGGISAGAFEVVRETLAPGGVRFVSVDMRPGRPQGIGRLPSGAAYFALPGTPAAAAVSFEVFVRPVLLRAQGRADVHRLCVRLEAAEEWSSRRGRTDFVPVVFDRSDPMATRIRRVSSRTPSPAALARADALAVVAPELEAVHPGDLVDVRLLT